jgi:predicted GNAT superfamily acetyltransferase
MSDATASAGKQGIRVRTMEETQEMSVCVALQRRIWGHTPIDTVPDQIFIVARKRVGR